MYVDKISLNEYDSSESSITIDGSIKHSKNNKLCYENIMTRMNYEDKMIMGDFSVLDKYRGLILQNILPVKITDNFFYKPELLSKEIYGTVDLWYLILFVNDIFHPAEFNQSNIFIFNPSRILLLNQIIEKERLAITQNNEDLPVTEDLTLKPVTIRFYNRL